MQVTALKRLEMEELFEYLRVLRHTDNPMGKKKITSKNYFDAYGVIDEIFFSSLTTAHIDGCR